jgi:hypothetical protein
MYKNVDFLTVEECKEIKEKLFSLREFWIDRSRALSPFDDVPFYCLGVASYIDSIRPGESHIYFDNAKLTNKIIKENFPQLFKKLEETLAKEFSCEIKYVDDFAVPGFQIYLADWFFEDFMGPKHCDFHHYLLDWKKYGIDFDPKENLSFTASIKLPKSGGGIYMWDKTYDYETERLKNLSYEQHRDQMYNIELPDEERTYFQYELGKIFFHSGNRYHQVAEVREMENDDERITLQGHAVKADNTLYLFW